jgi:hypothetical protein
MAVDDRRRRREDARPRELRGQYWQSVERKQNAQGKKKLAVIPDAVASRLSYSASGIVPP